MKKTLLNILFLLLSTLHTYAVSSDITPPDFNFWLGKEGAEMSHVLGKGEEYFLTATIDWKHEKHHYAEEYGLDIYFGVEMPETGEIFTWHDNDNGNRVLSKGYIPILYNTLEGKITIDAKPHTFSDHDRQGMYRAFIILVKTGAYPSNPTNWKHAQEIPFYYEDNHSSSNSSSIASSVIGHPEENADAVIIFIPAVDMDLSFHPDKREIIGEIVSTLKGSVDGKIYHPKNSLTRSLIANEPVRMSLVKHHKEDYYYPIYIINVIE